MTGGSLILGLLNGITLGLLAVGLVLVYRSNRFLNLAHGEMGIISAQVLAKLVIDDGWSWWAAALVALPIGVLIGMAIDRLAIRPLRQRKAAPAAMLLVTVGITQVLIGLSLLQAFAANPTKLEAQGYPMPFQAHLAVGGLVLNGSDVLAAVAVPLILAALIFFLRATTLGKSIRAAASNADAARLCGVSTNRVSMVVWAIAGALSAFTAILQAPDQSGFQAGALGPYFLFLALGAAALAAFTSIGLAMVGGVAIGLADQLTLAATKSGSDAELVVFLVVVAIVILRGKAIGSVFSVTGAAIDDRPPLRLGAGGDRVAWIRNRNRIFPVVALIIAVLAPLLPVLTSESNRFQLSLLPIYALAALSLTVALGWAGQISLGQFAFVGIGAFMAARLLEHHWTLLFLIVVAGLIGALVMVLIGIPALRVPGLTLAVTTLGFALVGPDWLFRQSWFGSDQASGVTLTPPLIARSLGAPKGHLVVYYLGLALVAVTSWGLVTLRRTQTGRAVIAVRDNPAAAASFGLTPAVIKVGAMGLAGFMAAAAGVLWADNWRYVTTNQFPANLSFAILALPVIGGVGSVAGAVAAAVLFEGATIFIAPHFNSLFGSLGSNIGFQLMLAGVSLTLVVLKTPGGLVAAAQTWLQRRADRALSTEAGMDHWERPNRPPLVANQISLHFGGIKALDGASIEVRPGEIVGLIGPNGAGKTTLINVLSGRMKADAGQVLLGEVDITDLPPEMRACFGLARSFQDARLFPGLTVLEAVQLAVAKEHRASIMASSFAAPWVRHFERSTLEQARAILGRFGLEPWAGSLTSELSTGTRRICDLAAQVASQPSVLLLDEPTAGVAQREAEAFGPLLRSIRDDLDCSIVIVEHDMPLLMGLCDRVYAMASGQVIASGRPDQVRTNPLVISSYLGTNPSAVNRSGGRTLQPADGATKKATSVARTRSRAAGVSGRAAGSTERATGAARRAPTPKARSRPTPT